MFGIPLTTIVAWAAIYVVVWWITIFAVLPIGVHSQDEAGSVTPGTEPGAPTKPRLVAKALVTTVIAAIIVILIYQFHGYLDDM
ncbi:Predicted secreted protein [Rhizobiales bacterium GAS191]|jgi:predicted secreted protein|nr:Predicted secreted protein [Rhizobiales bacterium GAS113]SEC00347.1 Predicted secreted protein [Rhizobiales bacterium GAS188]SED21928.1 Predicted secreted protein [Rhizobiales bacterium GAS191]